MRPPHTPRIIGSARQVARETGTRRPPDRHRASRRHLAHHVQPAIRALLDHPALAAVIVPSRAEPFGRIPLEAYATGASPVIATTAGGLAETVTEPLTGYTASPADPPRSPPPSPGHSPPIPPIMPGCSPKDADSPPPATTTPPECGPSSPGLPPGRSATPSRRLPKEQAHQAGSPHSPDATRDVARACATAGSPQPRTPGAASSDAISRR